MAQRRSAGTALDYVRGLAPGVTANCWWLAEAAGHERPYRMQALLRCYRWDWKDLRAELPALARAWLPCDPGDLTGPGLAVDETAQLKDGDATACVAPRHAGCTGHVENCVTTVFPAWVATSGHTALAALAQLRDTAIRNHLCGDITSQAPPFRGVSETDRLCAAC